MKTIVFMRQLATFLMIYAAMTITTKAAAKYIN